MIIEFQISERLTQILASCLSNNDGLTTDVSDRLQKKFKIELTFIGTIQVVSVGKIYCLQDALVRGGEQ